MQYNKFVGSSTPFTCTEPIFVFLCAEETPVDRTMIGNKAAFRESTVHQCGRAKVSCQLTNHGWVMISVLGATIVKGARVALEETRRHLYSDSAVGARNQTSVGPLLFFFTRCNGLFFHRTFFFF